MFCYVFCPSLKINVIPVPDLAELNVDFLTRTKRKPNRAKREREQDGNVKNATERNGTDGNVKNATERNGTTLVHFLISVWG